jgi:urate oxidase
VKEITPKFNAAWEAARAITIKLFAEDESASVQNTMYKMCEQILDAVPETETVSYSLPNKHYFELGKFPKHCCVLDSDKLTNQLTDLSWHNDIKNTGKDAEVYVPQSGPNGLIKCEVSRS